MRRTSPPPRKKPAAFENVGVAVIAVAANAPRSPRRVKPVDLSFVMIFAPVPSLNVFSPYGEVAILSPDAWTLLHTSIRGPRPLSTNPKNKREIGEFLRKG